MNVLIGANGAGKTSVLEAIALLAGGRSFRSARIDPVVSRERGALEVYAEVQGLRGAERLGISRSAGQWNLRANGQTVSRLSRLTETLAAVFFEPDSHDLLAGGSEGRRRFLDWGVFHVEHQFGSHWGRYQKALQQRNALLKQPSVDRQQLEVWNAELAQAGEWVAGARDRFMQLFRSDLESCCARLSPELGPPQLRLARGWSNGTLTEELAVSLERDHALGHTSRGPHRADWSLKFSAAGGKDELSRGQMKLACFALSRAMVEVFTRVRGEAPVACMDDLFSELDSAHQIRCLEALQDSVTQVWVTGTELQAAVAHWKGPLKVFHVEQGKVTARPPSAL